LGDAWQSLYLDGAGTDPRQFAEAAGRIKGESEGRVKTVIKRFVRTDRDVEALIEEVPAWRAAGADDIVVWFGEVAGFGARQERFARACPQRRTTRRTPFRELSSCSLPGRP
jgi:hypothetical protein